jgi:hypothetical protein
VIASLVLLRVFAAIASPVLLALVFMVFAAIIIWCQWRANETDNADPLVVRNRGAIASPPRPHWSNAIAGAGRATRAWLSSAVPVVTALPSRFATVVTVLRRERTRDTLRQWLHVTTDALSGIPPPDVSPPALEDSASGEETSPSSRHAA